MDRIGRVSQTYKKHRKKIARIHSTPQDIRECVFIMRSILQVTQGVVPACASCTFTHLQNLDPACRMAWEVLKISKIEKSVSIDHTRHCIQTYNKNKKIYPRITSTVKVIQPCIFI